MTMLMSLLCKRTIRQTKPFKTVFIVLLHLYLTKQNRIRMNWGRRIRNLCTPALYNWRTFISKIMHGSHLGQNSCYQLTSQVQPRRLVMSKNLSTRTNQVPSPYFGAGLFMNNKRNDLLWPGSCDKIANQFRDSNEIVRFSLSSSEFSRFSTESVSVISENSSP